LREEQGLGKKRVLILNNLLSRMLGIL